MAAVLSRHNLPVIFPSACTTDCVKVKWVLAILPGLRHDVDTIFRVNSPLWGNPPVTGRLPRKWTLMRSGFLWCKIERVSNWIVSGRWFEAPWGPCDVIMTYSLNEIWPDMMTSSNGNVFRVTDPLRENPVPVTRSFDVLFDLRLNKRSRKQSRRRWLETPSRTLWRHSNDIVLFGCNFLSTH